MQKRSFPGFTFAEFQPLPVGFRFAAFRELTPLDDANIWEFVYERNLDAIGVKRKRTALENLEKIFLATFRLANTLGFRAMTLRDLCGETGLSMGGLYGYIESKDQLAAMIADVIGHISQISPRWFSHIPDPLDQLDSALRGYVYFSEVLQPWFYFMFLESRTLSPDQRNVAKDAELRVQSRLAALLDAAGAFGRDEAQLLAAHCMALVQDWHLKRWKYRAADVAPDAFADSVVKLVRSRVEGSKR